MLKVKLIESREYYSRRRYLMILQMFLIVFPGFILVRAHEYSASIVVTATVVMILTLVMMARNQKQFTSLTGKRMMELEEDRVRVNTTGKPGGLDIPLSSIDTIVLPDSLSLPMADTKEYVRELTGNGAQSYLILNVGDKKHRFDFVIDSYYLLDQFNKMVQVWTDRGYRIERV